jgi:predicted amidohydrolase
VIIALASPRVAETLDDGLEKVRRSVSEASARGASVVCFPEAYLPGLRGQDFEVLPFDEARQERLLRAVSQWAREYAIAVILGTERLTETGRQIAAFVFDSHGGLQGYQTKNQLDPTEDRFYVPGDTRRLFEAGGVKFGVAICHEGWRYPETVRHAAVHGAQIVFHPHLDEAQPGQFVPASYADPRNTFHEKAMLCRAAENTIYVASVNYAARSATTTAFVNPDGSLHSHQPYGEAGLLVADLDLAQATRLLATRCRS